MPIRVRAGSAIAERKNIFVTRGLQRVVNNDLVDPVGL